MNQGFAEADVIVEREYRTPTYDHLFMEPECSIGVPAGYDTDHQKLTIYVGSQIPYADRQQTAAAMGLPEEDVRVIGPLIGGAFGGKEDIMGQIHAALLAQATGRPVKILYDRAESLLAHPKRHATVIRIKTGAKRDGTLTAVQAELTGDAGAYASLSTKVLKRATTHATGPYQVPHAKIDCYAMYTNNPPAGAFRGFGVTQSAFAVESNMDLLAHELGITPFELRRKNALRVGATTATGQVLRESVGLLDCLDWVEARVQELDPAQIPDSCQLPSSDDADIQIAWGLAAAYKNTGFGGGADDVSNAEVEVYPDGTAEIRSSSADMGQGLTTVMAQLPPKSLGCPSTRCASCSPTPISPRTAARPQPAARPSSPATPRVWRAHDARQIGRSRSRAVGRSARHDSLREWHAAKRKTIASMAEAVQWLQAEGHETRLTYRYSAPATLAAGSGRRYALRLQLRCPGRAGRRRQENRRSDRPAHRRGQ